MKSYTDLEQSKKLAEILPLESADYHYITQGEKSYFYSYSLSSDAIKDYDEEIKYIPCWSLAALIDIIENIDKLQKVEVSFTHNSGKYWVNVHFDEFGSFCQDHELYDSKIDALIAIIKKLKSRNLL